MTIRMIAGAALALSLLGAGAAVVNAAPAPAPAADPVKGKAVFARCMVCHDLNTGANRIGPSLKGVVGRKAGTAAGFAYSPAMKAKGVVWNPATLNAFLTAPTTYVKGNKMAFPGMANAQERANLIAYLKQSAR